MHHEHYRMPSDHTLLLTDEQRLRQFDIAEKAFSDHQGGNKLPRSNKKNKFIPRIRRRYQLSALEPLPYDTQFSFINVDGLILMLLPGKEANAILGDGCWAKVKYAYDRYGTQYVVKIEHKQKSKDHFDAEHPCVLEEAISTDLGLFIASMRRQDEVSREQGYHVMPLLGRDLKSKLSFGTDLPTETLMRIAVGMCWQVHLTQAGLSSKSGRGYVHRDIKLDNFVISSGNKVQLLDFGLAAEMIDEKPKNLKGTMNYLPLCAGEVPLRNSDVIALKRCLYMPESFYTPEGYKTRTHSDAACIFSEEVLREKGLFSLLDTSDSDAGKYFDGPLYLASAIALAEIGENELLFSMRENQKKQTAVVMLYLFSYLKKDILQHLLNDSKRIDALYRYSSIIYRLEHAIGKQLILQTLESPGDELSTFSHRGLSFLCLEILAQPMSCRLAWVNVLNWIYRRLKDNARCYQLLAKKNVFSALVQFEQASVLNQYSFNLVKQGEPLLSIINASNCKLMLRFMVRLSSEGYSTEQLCYIFSDNLVQQLSKFLFDTGNLSGDMVHVLKSTNIDIALALTNKVDNDLLTLSLSNKCLLDALDYTLSLRGRQREKVLQLIRRLLDVNVMDSSLLPMIKAFVQHIDLDALITSADLSFYIEFYQNDALDLLSSSTLDVAQKMRLIQFIQGGTLSFACLKELIHLCQGVKKWVLSEPDIFIYVKNAFSHDEQAFNQLFPLSYIFRYLQERARVNTLCQKGWSIFGKITPTIISLLLSLEFSQSEELDAISRKTIKKLCLKLIDAVNSGEVRQPFGIHYKRDPELQAFYQYMHDVLSARGVILPKEQCTKMIPKT